MPYRRLRLQLVILCLALVSLSLKADTTFVRGDVNGDGMIDIADPTLTLRYLFQEVPVDCQDAADANDDGEIDIGDAIHGLAFLFALGSPFPPPMEAPGVNKQCVWLAVALAPTAWS